MIYFCSDLHFSHQNIIKYCDRPWATVEEMNEALIANWNSVVKPEDTVWHLGDVAMGPKSKHPEIVARLNGHKLLIRGNHDANHKKMVALGFEASMNDATIDTPVGKVYLRHVPTLEFKADWHFCGHVHKAWKHWKKTIVNVGVDVRDYKPVTLEELIASVETEDLAKEFLSEYDRERAEWIYK